MRRYRTFFPGYWTSADIVDLPSDTKLLGAYLLTSPHANMIGCFRLPNAYVVDDLRMGSETVSKGFRNLCVKGFITHDSALSWVLINKFLKWNPIENPNQGIAASKIVAEVPQNSSVYAPLLDMLRLNPRNFPDGFINGLGTVRKPFRNQEQEQEQEQEPQEELSLLSPEPATGPRISDFYESWNRLCGRLPKAETFSDSRRKKVKARIRQGVTLERFEQAVKACTQKPFLRGENDRGWTATFDWLIANDRNIEKAITDTYGFSNGVQRSTSVRSEAEARWTTHIAEIGDSNAEA